MSSIEIIATIEHNKLNEFVNTQKTLLRKLDNVQELKRLESDLLNNTFRLKLYFDNGHNIDEIIKSKWYNYIIGAIDVLGEKTNIVINS